MSDAYSAERAGYAERLARLAGGTTYREPVGGYGTPSDYMPDVHAMAASLAFARRGKADIGPDVALAVICRKMAYRRKVATELAAALREHSVLLAECQTAMLGHLYETAASLSPEQAERYLEEMTPHVLTMTVDHASGSPLH